MAEEMHRESCSFVANKASRILHSAGCPWVMEMADHNCEYFEEYQHGVQAGYLDCVSCLVTGQIESAAARVAHSQETRRRLGVSAQVERVSKYIDGRPQRVWRATCTCCGSSKECGWQNLSDDDVAIKNYRNQGWTFGKVSRCPDCTKKMKAAKIKELAESKAKENRKQLRVVEGNQGGQKTSEGPIKSLKDLAAGVRERQSKSEKEQKLEKDNGAAIDWQVAAKISGRLAAVFKDGAFAKGHDDKSIAKDCDVDASVVRQIRKATYGTINLPPELAALKDESDAIKGMVEDYSKRLKAAVERFED